MKRILPDQLYDAAFQYKKTRLWKKLWDNELFAVKMPDGVICYISIMGAIGEYCAIGVYPGERGFESFRRAFGALADERTSYFQDYDNMYSQCCYQLVLENKQELDEDEVREVRSYAKAHKIRLAGKNAYPHFLKFEPYRIPWRLQGRKDQVYMYEALKAAIRLAEMLTETSPSGLGIREVQKKTEYVPLLEPGDDGYQVTGMTRLPEEREPVYAKPKRMNEIGLRNIKKLRKKGIWECEIILLPEPVQDDPEEAPFFAHTLMAVSKETEYLLPVEPVVDYEQNPEKMVDLLIGQFYRLGAGPKEFRVRDKRTYALLKGLADKLSAPIRVEEELPELDEAQERMLEYFEDGFGDEMQEMMKVIEMILQMDKRELNSMPKELKRQLEMEIELLLDSEALPDDIADELADKLDLY